MGSCFGLIVFYSYRVWITAACGEAVKKLKPEKIHQRKWLMIKS